MKKYIIACLFLGLVIPITITIAYYHATPVEHQTWTKITIWTPTPMPSTLMPLQNKSQVEQFMLADTTDQHPYTSTYQCGNYSADVVAIPTPTPPPTPTPTPPMPTPTLEPESTPIPTPIICPRAEYSDPAWYCFTIPVSKPDGSDILRCKYGTALPLQNRLEVKQFMEWDTTDKHLGYNCANFVDDVCNNASKHEIEAYPVVLWFTDGKIHAIVEFPTIEDGDIYIDATQGDWWSGTVEVGQQYDPINFYNPNWHFFGTTIKIVDRIMVYD